MNSPKFLPSIADTELHINEETQQRLRIHLENAEKINSRDEHWEPWLKATAKHRKIAEMRFDLLSRIEDLIAGGMTKTDAIQIEILETQELVRAALKLMPLKEAEREVEQRMGRLVVRSEMTIYRWYGYIKGLGKHDWLPALLPGYKGCVGKFTIKIGNAELNTMLGYNAEILQVFSDHYLDRDQRTYSYAYRLTTEYAEAKNLGEVPSIATLIRHLNKAFSKQVQNYRREGKEASGYKNAAPRQDRDVSMLHALKWINGASYKHKIYIKFPDGTICQPVTWIWQDVYSGMILSFSVGKTRDISVFCMALYDVLQNFGLGVNNIPLKIRGYCPNKNFNSNVTEKQELLAILDKLGIECNTLSMGSLANTAIRRFGNGGIGEYVDKSPEIVETASNPLTTTLTYKNFSQMLRREIDSINHKKRRFESDPEEIPPVDKFDRNYQRNTVLKATEQQLGILRNFYETLSTI